MMSIGIGIGLIIVFITWWAYEMGKQSVIRQIWPLTPTEFELWRKVMSGHIPDKKESNS